MVVSKQTNLWYGQSLTSERQCGSEYGGPRYVTASSIRQPFYHFFYHVVYFSSISCGRVSRA